VLRPFFLNQDFLFRILGVLHRSSFLHLAAPERVLWPRNGPVLPSPGTERPESRSFPTTSHTPLPPPSFLRPVCCAAAAPIRLVLATPRSAATWPLLLLCYKRTVLE
jgi:hypothetical protein